jgi:hypothetical protein
MQSNDLLQSGQMWRFNPSQRRRVTRGDNVNVNVTTGGYFNANLAVCSAPTRSILCYCLPATADVEITVNVVSTPGPEIRAWKDSLILGH